jgi:hypothetical protein
MCVCPFPCRRGSSQGARRRASATARRGRRTGPPHGPAQDPAAAAAAARAGTLDEAGRSVVAEALGRLEAALRARTSSAQF